jgi:hypothetical protein
LVQPIGRGARLLVKVAPRVDTGASRDAMKFLNFLMESFINAFGITRPRPEQQRTAALVLGGFLLLFFAALVSLFVWMLTNIRR